MEEIIDLPKNNDGATGDFNINCFLVYSGKLRFVHNFVPVNQNVQDDTGDVPGIDVAFRRIAHAGPVIFSKLDLKSAYLQIQLRHKDRSVCAFTCDVKRYRFITAPLGLKVIPSQFQRWLKALLQENGCHIDDIVIFSDSVDDHIKHISRVLQALSFVYLTIQPKKCIFFATKLPVLGMWLEIGGMRPDNSKLFNMMQWERPNTRKKVQSLIGIINFFRRFVPNASELLLPIMNSGVTNVYL